MKEKRLNNDDFIALRSLGKEPWILDGYVLWKINKKWRSIYVKGFYYEPRGYYDSSDYDRRAYEALCRLEDLQLVVDIDLPCRCCSDPKCDSIKDTKYELTEKGWALFEKISPKPEPTTSATTVEDPPENNEPEVKVNNWFNTFLSFFSRSSS